MKRALSKLLAIDPAALGAGFALFMESNPIRPNEAHGSVAVVNIFGELEHHTSECVDSYEAIRARAKLAFESGATAVVLRIDSPGGLVSGCFELSRDLRAMAEAAGKPLFAFVDGAACSAAYAIATAGEQVIVAPSSAVGSIGVVHAMVDATGLDSAMGLRWTVIASGARKSDGNPHVPVTDAAVAATQERVDALAAQFFDLVAAHRGLSVDAIGALEARVVHGVEAVSLGLADQVGSLEGLIAMVALGPAGSTSPVRAEGSIMNEEEKKAIAALRALAKGEGPAAERARKALAAMAPDEEPDGDEPKGEGEPDGDEPKKDPPPAAEEDPGDTAPADDKKKPEAAAIASIDRRMTALEQGRERDRLLASRPDVMQDKATAKLLATAPLAHVKQFLKDAPVRQVASPAAAVPGAPSVRPTAGGTGEQASRLPPEEARALDQRFGLGTKEPAIRREPGALVLGVMTPKEAREYLAAREGSAR